MFKKILVPLDGTPQAAAVLPLVGKLARAHRAELILARVTPNFHLDAPENVAAREELTHVAAEAELADLGVRTAVLYGDVAEQLVEEARTAGAELIAMATHGRGGLARAWLGSVTERVLAHSPVPVLVLRAGTAPPTELRTLLVPFDGTAGSVAALAMARELAALSDARLALVQVIPPLPRWGEGWEMAPGWEEEARGSVQRTLDWLVGALSRQGVAATGRALVGPVAATLATAASDAGADLIVMGTRALTGPKRALLGSVADATVRTATLPVLLVRQAADDRSGPGAAIDERGEALPDLITPPATEA